jgi:hypothetical protein
MVSAKVGTQRPGFSIRLSVIDGSADRFLYFNDDMMLVGPVESTDFFSNEGKVNLRGPRGPDTVPLEDWRSAEPAVSGD